MRRRFPLSSALALSLAVAVGGCASSSTVESSSASAPAAAVPLGGAVPTDHGTVATVAMGRLAEPLNTFWQTFVLSGATGRWALRTPTGVADNGGLVVSADTTETVVGFRASQLLAFSPLAVTADGGDHYSTGVLPGALAHDPDALGVSAGGLAVALLGRDVLTSQHGLTGWRTATTLARLNATSPGRACSLGSLTAVAATTAGTYVGGSCTTAGVVGLFSLDAAKAASRGLTLPRQDAADHAEVLRAVPYGNGLAVLLALRGRTSTAVLAAWEASPGAPWSMSAALTLHGALTATSVTTQTGFAVLTGGADPAAADVEPGTGPAWKALPTPPAGSAAIAVTGSRVDALAVHTSTLTDFRLSTGDRWVDDETLHVAIDYGSSS